MEHEEISDSCRSMDAFVVVSFVEAMKDITVCPTVHTLQGALKDSDRPALERIAEELLAD